MDQRCSTTGALLSPRPMSLISSAQPLGALMFSLLSLHAPQLWFFRVGAGNVSFQLLGERPPGSRSTQMTSIFSGHL